jgi:hypothetical protein
MSIVYTQYWLQFECEANFAKHFKVLKTWYYEPKMLGFHELSSIIPLVFNHW